MYGERSVMTMTLSEDDLEPQGPKNLTEKTDKLQPTTSVRRQYDNCPVVDDQQSAVVSFQFPPLRTDNVVSVSSDDSFRHHLKTFPFQQSFCC